VQHEFSPHHGLRRPLSPAGAALAFISFEEAYRDGIWTIEPVPYPRMDTELYRFIIELQLGTRVSLQSRCLGFSDAANFRHAFRRWTKKTPREFRLLRSGERASQMAT
jgi:AraC-like DNA-binding protein